MAAKYGHLVRLWGIQPAQLPDAHATPQDLTPLLTSIFLEAVPFISDVPSGPLTSSSSWSRKGTKKFPHSTAPVELFERTISAADLRLVTKEYHLKDLDKSQLQPESWVLRRSCHGDASVDGTASFEEFRKNFKEDHAEAEKEFTPAVMSTSLKREWNCAGVEVELDGTTWVDWTLKLEESTHKMPAPLKDRIFPVLQATAAARGRREFFIVQIAVRDPKLESDSQGETVRGAYSSVERLRLLEESGEGRGETEWVMGTVSDARGVLPAWVQKMAVPGAIAKDVNLFLDWIAKERKKDRSVHKKEEQPGSQAAVGTDTNGSGTAVAS